MQDYLNETQKTSFGSKAALLAIALHVALVIAFYMGGSSKPEKPAQKEQTQVVTPVAPVVAKKVKNTP